MKKYLSALLIILCTSTIAKATPPPIPTESISIAFDENSDFNHMKKIAVNLCNNADKNSYATQIMCLYAQNANISNDSNHSPQYQGIYITFKSPQQLIETAHAAEKACYYGNKNNTVTTIMCEYARATKDRLNLIQSCLKQPYESNNFKDINYCINDGYRGFNHP
ncbi:hypothetical protein [Commensalibacter oyaizuii]|uniref:Uncharacterized protein n=1 Tax=Commensalibacter oyaizuii TaxID=3043873 RepID=A0ABT6Q3V3_9PROT|nr:hypothetical protein [Commensalibacter sp. TBRC 16381]MDI2091779.1 hypothetical protein [Commensalibacter sp. TBRC 16381]